MKKRGSSTDGAVIIETSIVLLMFIFVILFIYGLFSITSAQNQITHALIQSSKSLSLDPYLTEHVDSVYEADTFWSSFGSLVLDLASLSNDKHFSSSGDWYNGDGDSSLAKDRFVGYFAGGDEAAADEKLNDLGVVDGLDGVKFNMVISGEDITITLKYELQFWFDALGVGKIPIQQAVTTKMWK